MPASTRGIRMVSVPTSLQQSLVRNIYQIHSAERLIFLEGNATAIYWNGIKSFGAGEYSLCLDCSEKDILISNNDTVQWIDGHTSNTSDSAVQTIWSMTDLKPREDDHVLRIRNQIDQRFGGSGLLSIDSLIITLPQRELSLVLFGTISQSFQQSKILKPPLPSTCPPLLHLPLGPSKRL
jgi:hypothetical protein